MMLAAVELAQITEPGRKVTGSQPYLPYVPGSP